MWDDSTILFVVGVSAYIILHVWLIWAMGLWPFDGTLK
jgi:hypothetical protein